MFPMLKRFCEKDAFETCDRRYFRLVDRSEGDMGLLISVISKTDITPRRYFQNFNHSSTIPKPLLITTKW